MPDSEAITLATLRPYISSQQPIPIEVMVGAFNTAAMKDRDLQYRQAAEDIIPEASAYLHPMELSWFLSARGRDDEARESIRERKAYIARAAKPYDFAANAGERAVGRIYRHDTGGIDRGG